MSSTGALPVAPFEFGQTGDFPDSFTYTVPATGEVQPYTATATFTNGSGQAIQPTISMYSAQGNLLARVFPVTAVADGDSAEVTWMPPFGSAASSSGGGGSGITEITSVDGTIGVTDPTGPITDLSVLGNKNRLRWSRQGGATMPTISGVRSFFGLGHVADQSGTPSGLFFTPTSTGNVIVLFEAFNHTNPDGTPLQLVTGIGTPPNLGDAATGFVSFVNGSENWHTTDTAFSLSGWTLMVPNVANWVDLTTTETGATVFWGSCTFVEL